MIRSLEACLKVVKKEKKKVIGVQATGIDERIAVAGGWCLIENFVLESVKHDALSIQPQRLVQFLGIIISTEFTTCLSE